MIISDISCRILLCTSKDDVYRIIDTSLREGKIVEIKETKTGAIEVKAIERVGDYYKK